MRENEPIIASNAMQRVASIAAYVARTRLPILITGETGTGKEVMAKFVHSRSGRRGPLVAVDCAAFAAELMESELFGHVRGSFTGATVERKGLLEYAHGGTAFFDEIGELPLHLQAKLLRALDRQEVRPIGSNMYRQIDFRIIAATNRDLKVEVAQGRFREDLYYRLAASCLRLPPLRERKEDIPLLAEHFANDSLAPELVAALMKYDWPGNVRELRNCVTCFSQIRICPLVDATSPHFGCAVVTGIAVAGSSAPLPGAEFVPPKRPPSMEHRTRAAITEALAWAHGSRSQAAQSLGISRTTMYRRMKAHGLIASAEAVGA